MWITTGEVYRLYSGLRTCFERLDGAVGFANEYGELDLTVTFSPKQGHVTVTGECRDIHRENALTFTLELDQSYIPETLQQLSRIVAEFGDDRIPSRK
jgi:hypothetical protein